MYSSSTHPPPSTPPRQARKPSSGEQLQTPQESYKSSLSTYHLSLQRAVREAQRVQPRVRRSVIPRSSSPTEFGFEWVSPPREGKDEREEVVDEVEAEVELDVGSVADLEPGLEEGSDSLDTAATQTNRRTTFGSPSHPSPTPSPSVGDTEYQPDTIPRPRARTGRHPSRRGAGYWSEIWSSDEEVGGMVSFEEHGHVQRQVTPSKKRWSRSRQERDLATLSATRSTGSDGNVQAGRGAGYEQREINGLDQDVSLIPGLSESSSPSSSENSNEAEVGDQEDEVRQDARLAPSTPSRPARSEVYPDPTRDPSYPCIILNSTPPSPLPPRTSPRKTPFNQSISLPIPPPARILFARQLTGVSSIGGGISPNGYGGGSGMSTSATDDSEDSFDAVQDSPMGTPMLTPPAFIRAGSYTKLRNGAAHSAASSVASGSGGHMNARVVDGNGLTKAWVARTRSQTGPRIRELSINGQDSWRSREHPVVPRGKNLHRTEDSDATILARPTGSSFDSGQEERLSHEVEDGARSTWRENGTMNSRQDSIRSGSTVETSQTESSPSSFPCLWDDPWDRVPATPERPFRADGNSGFVSPPSTPNSGRKDRLFRRLTFQRGNGNGKEKEIGSSGRLPMAAGGRM